MIASPQNGLGPITTVRAETVGAWRENRLAYFNAPLAHIVADAARYHPSPIIIADDSLRDLKISAIFDGADVKAMFATLSEAFPVEVEATADGGFILRERS